MRSARILAVRVEQAERVKQPPQGAPGERRLLYILWAKFVAAGRAQLGQVGPGFLSHRKGSAGSCPTSRRSPIKSGMSMSTRLGPGAIRDYTEVQRIPSTLLKRFQIAMIVADCEVNNGPWKKCICFAGALFYRILG